MSTDRSLAGLIVRAAARTLPPTQRERYREQWLADLRDADEAGVRASGIALASLVFAVSLARPLAPGWRTPDPETAARRVRLAAGLAVSAALLGLSQCASIGGSGVSVTDNTGYDYLTFVATGFLVLYAIAAPIAAVALVSITRDTAVRVRAGVWMLVPVGLTQLAQPLLGSEYFTLGWSYGSPVTLAYPVAFVLVAAGVLVLRGGLPPAAHSGVRGVVVLTAGASGVVTLALAAAGVFAATGLWAARTPLVFGNPISAANRANYEQWLQLRDVGDRMVTSAFVTSTICGVVLSVVVVAAALRAKSVRSAVTVGIAGGSVTLLGVAALFGFLDLMVSGTVPPQAGELLLFLGRVGVIGAALSGIGGMRGVTVARTPRLTDRVRAPH